MSSVIVHNFSGVGVPVIETETQPPLIVDSDAVRTGAVAFERFESVARRYAKEVQRCRCIQLGQLALRDTFEPDKAAYPISRRKPLGVLASKAPNHAAIISDIDTQSNAVA